MKFRMHASDFFVAGGTLRPDSPSYVKRPADDELFHLASAGQFCYVLTARQMGKSSLMIRAARRLGESGIRTAIIDLTKIGTDVSVEQWYLGLITRLKGQLKLSVDPEAWWTERASLGAVQRFTDFLHDVVLTEIEGSAVIFIDEIDTTLNLDFSDDFFAAIRACYNARASNPAYNRLAFVLLGVATPADLIKDRSRTPFNIGQGIDLYEFSREDAQVLQQGLKTACPEAGDAIFARIFYWTNGHPYLTQKLCLAAAEMADGDWTDDWVDEQVEELFLSEEARKETNLKFVRDRIRSSPQWRRLLTLYRRVYQGETIPEDERSLDQNRLKLYGLVRAEKGVLQVRNEIYRRAFNLDWIKANTSLDWTRPLAIVTVVIALLLAGVLGSFALNRSPQIPNGDFENGFAMWMKEGILPIIVVCECDFGEDLGNPFPDCAARIGDPNFPAESPNSVPLGRGTISQGIRVPEVITSHLTFDYKFCSYDDGTYDALEIAVNSVNFPIWKIGNTTGTYPKCYYKQGEVVDLSKYRGEDVIIFFSVWNTDLPQYNSWAYIDNIRLEFSR